jgi:HlyD family secretion protein
LHWTPFATLLIGVVVSACNTGQAETPSTVNEYAVVERRDLDVRAEAAGTVEPIRTVEVKSKASGEVLALPVETGDIVQQGDLLAEIDPRDVNNQFRQAEADLAVAEARFETSVRQRERTEELLTANVVTQQELESAKLEEANANAALIKARTNLELNEERLKDVTIRAPIGGVIISRPVEVGTIIASASGNVSGGTPLMTMADLSNMQVRSLIDETDLGKIRPGMPVQVSVEAYPERRFNGEVLKIEPLAVIDQNVTMFPVLVQLDNRDGLLKVGMNADVQIEIATRENALVIPNSAVVSPQDAVPAGLALGLPEEVVRAALRSRPVNDGQQQVAAGDSSAGAGGAPAQTGQAAECQTIMQRAREIGMQNLSADDRAKLGACRPQGGRRGGRGGGAGGGANRANGTTPGVVFVAKGDSTFEPRNVTLGVNDFEFTEVLRGLEEGERVVIVSVARLQQQQQEFLTRMRERNAGQVIPGAGGGGGRGPGGGGGRGR